MDKAVDFGLDLVEVQPNAEPPVCKILDYGKFKYAQKRANEARRSRRPPSRKSFRPNIDEHDYQVKMRNVNKFYQAGQGQGDTAFPRSNAHQSWRQCMAGYGTRLTKSLVEAMPKMEGRQMVMVLAPRCGRIFS